MSKMVMVAGTGKSGISAARLLLKHDAPVLLFDENKDRDINMLKNELGDSPLLEIRLGETDDELLDKISMMIISPGIPMDAPFVEKIKAHDIPIWSEIELAYSFDRGSIAAITGTNGKTTTTALTGEIVKAWNPDTIVVGNIGIPYTELCDTTTGDSITVAEISSFQLETIVDFRPKVSAILNLTPDHLNRHHTFENYGNIKLSIAKNQSAHDVIILNYDDENTRTMGDRVDCNAVYFSRKEILENGIYVENGKVIISDNGKKHQVMELKDFKLMGDHNVENLLAAAGIAYYMGVPVEIIGREAALFKSVEHRIEYVDTINGVAYYNDSKGTNPDAAIKGIQAMTAPTFLIGGGYDKDSEYDEWIESFDGRVKELVLIGETADKIAETASKHGFTNIIKKDSLESAVMYCSERAEAGDAVLLSPACASWDMFDNYEQRGKKFKEYVACLKG